MYQRLLKGMIASVREDGDARAFPFPRLIRRGQGVGGGARLGHRGWLSCSTPAGATFHHSPPRRELRLWA